MYLGEFLSLLDHRISFESDNLGADRPINDVANLDERMAKNPALLRHERRVCRYTVQHAKTCSLMNLFYVRGVQI